MKTARKKRLNKITRVLRKWHGRIGLFTAVFVIFLAISGIALNHTHGLNLASSHISQSWLLDHYGIQTPNKVEFYQQGVVQVTDNLVWLDQNLLVDVKSAVVGVTEFSGMLLVVTQQQLYLFTPTGQLVDRLDSASGLPADIRQVRVTDSQLVLKTETGDFVSNQDMLEWSKLTNLTISDENPEPQWLRPVATIEQDKVEQAINQYRSQYLTLERVILDAHSGRLFGNIGVLFMDLVALMLITLCLSGVYVWFKQNNKK